MPKKGFTPPKSPKTPKFGKVRSGPSAPKAVKLSNVKKVGVVKLLTALAKAVVGSPSGSKTRVKHYNAPKPAKQAAPEKQKRAKPAIVKKPPKTSAEPHSIVAPLPPVNPKYEKIAANENQPTYQVYPHIEITTPVKVGRIDYELKPAFTPVVNDTDKTPIDVTPTVIEPVAQKEPEVDPAEVEALKKAIAKKYGIDPNNEKVMSGILNSLKNKDQPK